MKGIILTASLALTLTAWAQEDSDRIQRLVDDLGSEDFDLRERAERALIGEGEKAVPALEEASQSKDLEIAERAKRILDEIKRLEKLPKQDPQGRGPFLGGFNYSITTPEYTLKVDGAGVHLKLSDGTSYEAESVESFEREYPDLAKKYLRGLPMMQHEFSFDEREEQDPQAWPFNRGRQPFRFRFGVPQEDWFDDFFRDPFGEDLGSWQERMMDQQRRLLDRLRNRFRGEEDEPFSREFEERDPLETVPKRPGKQEKLGLRVDAVDETLRAQLGIAEGEGVLVEEVESGSAAEKAGIKKHDILTSVAGEKVGNPWAMRRRVRDVLQKGDDVEISLIRNSKLMTVRVKVGKAPEEF